MRAFAVLNLMNANHVLADLDDPSHYDNLAPWVCPASFLYEVAFYDALAQSESAIDVLSDAQLRTIAAELVKQARQNGSLDWTLRESAKAKIRVLVRRILRKYGYPPDAQARAVETVLEQAELLCGNAA